jgi:RHS repeat-associated protein
MAVQESLPFGGINTGWGPWNLYQGCVPAIDPHNGYNGFLLVEILNPYDIWVPGAGYSGNYFDFTGAPATPVVDQNSGTAGNDGGEGAPCGCNSAAPVAGDPINFSTGNKYLQEDDFVGDRWLTFRRFYNSALPNALANAANPISASNGSNWSNTFSRVLIFNSSASTATISVMRPDGSEEIFNNTGTSWVPASPSIADTLTQTTNAEGAATYVVFIAALRQYETYNVSGLLQSVVDETGQGITLTYSTSSTPTTVAPIAGLLIAVTDPEGRQLNFIYNNGQFNITQVTLPDGGTLNYSYGSNDNLLSVEYPDGKTRQYVYSESSLTGGTSLPNAMTGIIDEAGVRYGNTTYNSSGHATSASFAGGVGTTQITYGASGTSSVQYPLGATVTMGWNTTNGHNQTASVGQACGPQCDEPWKTRTYDANSNPLSYTDFNGNVKATTYSSQGLLTQEVDAQGQSTQRTTNTTWNTTLLVPLQRTVTNASGTAVTSTSWVYNNLGQPLARCEIDPALAGGYTCSATGTVPAGVRRWTYTYCSAVGSGCPLAGLMLSATGPRTDLTQTTTYTYYTTSSASGCGTPGAACYMVGDLYQVTDALGHVTTVASYDADGRMTRITDPNGVYTDMTYTPRGWLASRAVAGEMTSFTYTAYGSVASVTDPDNVTTTYTYDTAHRLTTVTDALGNYVQYTLDAAGDKTAEQVYDSTGALHKNLARTFNTLGQITGVVDGLNNTVFNAGSSGSYDADGNLLQSADALGIQSKLGYDALNRLTSTIANYNGADPATTNTTTTVSLDALDRLAGVTDPTALATSYSYDGLSNRTQLQSPDTGTSTDTFDAAGNRLTHTDAKGVVSTSTYDADNRPVSTSYTNTALNVSYTYDEANAVTGCSASNPIGRMTRVVEGVVTTVFCYDGRGNVIQKMQLLSGYTDVTNYGYTAANRLSGESTPDQTAISYTYDSDGRVSGVVVTPSGATTVSPTVVSAISYLPFGPISSYTLGNGQTITRTYDANYRLTDLTSPALNLHFARDVMGNVVALGNAPGANPATETYSYDPLYRLTGITDAGTVLESYTYNQTGDRLSKTAPGLATGAYLYTPGTHQLASIGNAAQANDADGNTTGSVMGGNTYGFAYNARNRLSLAQLNGQTVGTYTYNAMGERINKVATYPQAVTERYTYNESDRLIGEYGTTNRDYIWLGNLPVAVVDNTVGGGVTTSTVNYVTADQLGTPRVVTSNAGNVIWSWAYQGNPWGEQQPTSTTGYVLNLRFPGQYYDAETGTSYNMFRTYCAACGRYQESDPIGLAGGISTYAAVGNNPLSHVDPLGLVNPDQPSPITALENAILEGNVDQIEMLEEAAGVSDDSALGRAAANANKINHIFGEAGHNLDALVKTCGSKGRALQQLTNAAIKSFPGAADGVKTVFVVNVNGIDVTVSGVGVNGLFRLGTAYIP